MASSTSSLELIGRRPSGVEQADVVHSTLMNKLVVGKHPLKKIDEQWNNMH